MALDSDCYGYVPLPNKEWRPSFEAARSFLATGARFLDLGCGVGTKVLRAQRSGLDAWGLELRPRYVRIAHKLGAQVIEGDARKVIDVIEDFDCVYLFHLLVDVEAEKALEQRTMTLMRPGSLLILYGVLLNPFDWAEIGPHVWCKP